MTNTEMSLKAQQALAKTRDLIAANRWTQGQFAERDDGEVSYCPVGAIRASIFGGAATGDPGDVWVDELIASSSYWEALLSVARTLDAEETERLTDQLDAVDGDASERENVMLELEAIVTRWNDDPRTSVDDVVDAIDRALA